MQAEVSYPEHLNSYMLDRMQTYGIKSSTRGQEKDNRRMSSSNKKQTMMELKYLTNNLFDQGRKSVILTNSFVASKVLSDKAIWGCN